MAIGNRRSTLRAHVLLLAFLFFTSGLLTAQTIAPDTYEALQYRHIGPVVTALRRLRAFLVIR